MADDRTLGDILADALTRDAEPRPLNIVERVIQSAIAEVQAERDLREQRIAADAMLLSGRVLAADLAPLLRASADEVFETLGHMPDAMLPHLCTPQGWMTLAGYVAGDLGRSVPAYTPTLH
jgi:hypothetical protein